MSKSGTITVWTRFVLPPKAPNIEAYEIVRWDLAPESSLSWIFPKPRLHRKTLHHSGRSDMHHVSRIFLIFLYTANVNRFASANKIRTCQRCRNALIQTFQMPEKWWSTAYKTSNGYFGCETTRQAGIVTGFSNYTSPGA